MRILVFSHKETWKSQSSSTGWATDGGFSIHMDYLSSIFEEMTIIVPEVDCRVKGEVYYTNPKINILPINQNFSKGANRKIRVLWWGISNYIFLRNVIKKYDAVHVPIPSDIGTIGMLIAKSMNKPLYVRHCGNWLKQETVMERFWKRFMEKYAGNQNVFLATGGGIKSPSLINKNIHWIFSSSITLDEVITSPRKKGTSGKFKIGIACRQTERKGTRLVLKALSLNKNYPIEFHVLGDGEDLMSFKEEAKKLNVEKGEFSTTIFHGKKNHHGVSEVLKQLDVFVFPTYSSEGFPKAVLEAMANGLPIITTNVSVLPTLVKDSGLIIDPIPWSILEAIECFIQDDAFYYRCSKNAIVEAKKYTLENWVQEIETHLKSAWDWK